MELPSKTYCICCWHLLFIGRANLVDKPSGKYPCRIQPVYVVDVASAIVAALKDDGSSMGKVYELGGPEIFTMHELVSLFSMISLFFFLHLVFHQELAVLLLSILQAELMFDIIREWPRYVKIPFPVAKASTSLMS